MNYQMPTSAQVLMLVKQRSQINIAEIATHFGLHGSGWVTAVTALLDALVTSGQLNRLDAVYTASR
jgi:predicted transcriptional regulator